jgi:hypothetical protein
MSKKLIVWCAGALFLASCASAPVQVYSREVPRSQDAVWQHLVERIRETDDKIIHLDEDGRRIKVLRELSLHELYQCSDEPPDSLIGDAEAEVTLWVEPSPDEGSLISSEAVIYATQQERSMGHRFDLFGGPFSEDNMDNSPGEFVPVIIKSNGYLELEYLGYTREQAAKLRQANRIQTEFRKIRSER